MMHQISDGLYVDFVEHGYIRLLAEAVTDGKNETVTFEMSLANAKILEALIGRHVVAETSYKIVN